MAERSATWEGTIGLQHGFLLRGVVCVRGEGRKRNLSVERTIVLSGFFSFGKDRWKGITRDEGVHLSWVVPR